MFRPSPRVAFSDMSNWPLPAGIDSGPKELLPLRAFASYSWAATDDVTTIDTLVAELRMRGFAVFRDRESLAPAAKLEQTIRRELAVADVVVPYITRQSLASDPVVELEFSTAAELDRGRDHPRLMPIVRNLGETHAAVTAATYPRLHYDFGAHWTQLAPSGDGPLPLDEVARYAADALRVALPDGSSHDEGAWRMQLATRGDRPAPWPVTIDATDLLGGPVPTAGDRQTWQRLYAALCDIKARLTAHRSRRDIEITTSCHLTAAIAAGYVFRAPTGWRLGAVVDGSTVISRSASLVNDTLNFTAEYGTFTAHGGVLAVVIDLVPRGIESAVVRSFQQPPRARLTITRNDTSAHISPAQFAAIAGCVATRIKQARAEVRAERVDLFIAVPAALALLLGAELGSLGCPIRLHEHHDDSYQPSLELPG